MLELDGVTTAPEVVIPNSFHAVWKMIQYGSERIIDLWYRDDDPAHSNTAVDLAEALVAYIIANGLHLFQPSIAMQDVVVYDTRQVPYTEGAASFPPGTTGQDGGPLDAPPATALRVTLRDGMVYKGGKPGFSLPGSNAGNVFSGIWAVAFREAVSVFVLGLLSQTGPIGGAIYTLAGKHLKVDKVVTNMTKPVTSFFIQAPTRTISKRNVDHGAL